MKIKFKIRTLITPLLFIFLVGVLMLGVCQTSAAQEAKPKPTPQVKKATAKMEKKIVVFKGMGAKQTVQEMETDRQLKPPPPLTPMEKTALFRKAMSENGAANSTPTIRQFAKLDARTTYITDKAWISFVDLTAITTGDNRVLFMNGDGLVLITVKPEHVGQWFMIDCAINIVVWSTYPFEIKGPDGSVTEMYLDKDESRLQVFLLAQNTERQFVSIKSPATFWYFFSCEITAAN